MTQRYYRFRSATALLGDYQELERQEIYFAPPEDLNDALEGFKHVIWKGDKILWTSLLRHYLFGLIEVTAAASVLGAEFDPRQYRHIAHMTDEDLPDAPIRTIYRNAVERLLATPEARHLLDGLVAREAVLSRSELVAFLRTIHPLVVSIVLQALEADGLSILAAPLDLEPILASVRELLDGRFALLDNGGDLRAELVETGEVQLQQIDLLNDVADEKLEERRSWAFLFRDYPGFYADALERMLFPPWFTSCFVKHPVHAAMWGIYADGHRGACLEFRATDNKERRPALNLHGVVGTGYGSDGLRYWSGDQDYVFEPVHYATDYPETDFFRSLGRLPRSKLQDFWYSDGKGTTSPLIADILEEREAWRQAYWARHSQVMATKLPQWAYEEEYRLILSGDIDRNEDRSRRKFRYRFPDLTGVIFGMNMAHSDKIAMIRILARKVATEKHFKLRFSQAMFSHQTGRIEIRPLILLSTQLAKFADEGASTGSEVQQTALDTLTALVPEQ